MNNRAKQIIKPMMSKIIPRSIAIVHAMTLLGRSRRINVPRFGEYFRISSLELVSYEIYRRGILGAVAELGVFRGDFAKHINQAFPDRKLYLFDTFEGFNEKDKNTEVINDFSSADQDFSSTSVDLVLSKMKHPKNCIVKQGYFPESSKGLNETFAFVSIDVDLFEPTYAGLVYFYQKLSGGAQYLYMITIMCIIEVLRKRCGNFVENKISSFFRSLIMVVVQ